MQGKSIFAAPFVASHSPWKEEAEAEAAPNAICLPLPPLERARRLPTP